MTLLSLLSYAAPYRSELALASLLMVLETAAALVIPWLGGRFAGELLSADVAASRLILPSLLAAFAIQAALKFANGLIEKVLRDAGVEFIAENGKGPGVRLCKPESPTRG